MEKTKQSAAAAKGRIIALIIMAALLAAAATPNVYNLLRRGLLFLSRPRACVRAFATKKGTHDLMPLSRVYRVIYVHINVPLANDDNAAAEKTTRERRKCIVCADREAPVFLIPNY